MQLVDLKDGSLSLEFRSGEADRVLHGLRSLGAVQGASGPLHDELKVEGERLIYHHEWDEPCLISMSSGGSAILRRLATDLARSQAA